MSETVDPHRSQPPSPAEGTVRSGCTPDFFSQFLTAADGGSVPMPPRGGPADGAYGWYVILREHARGGLGRVCLARDTRLGRDVALKEIRPDRTADPIALSRFLNEAAVTGQLEHPGVVPVYALHEGPGGKPYYAMRFIQGRTLSEAIRAHHERPTPLGFRDLLQRFVAVCQTVAYAHSRGVLHRDLKPDNVMLGAYGETLLVDWGLAKRLGRPGGELVGPPHDLPTEAAADALTQAGCVIGTPAYMAPEQARGELDSLGPATDVYALGAILFTILAGGAPYPGNVRGVVEQVRQGPPPPRPGQRRPGVPRALEAVCVKAMAADPAGRYPSAANLARDVERWLADEPVAAWREPWADRARRWARRHRTAVACGAVAAVLAVAAALGGLYQWERAERQRRDQAREHLADLRRAGETQEQLGVSELQAGRFAGAEQIFARAREAPGDEPALADLKDRLSGRWDRARRLVESRRLTARAEHYLIRSLDHEAIAAYQASLERLGVLDRPDWWEQLPPELTEPQRQRLRRDLHIRLLTLAGIQARSGLLGASNPQSAADGLRAALPLVEAAQRYERSYTGDYIERFCRVGLGQPVNRLRIDAEPRTPTDFFFLGLLHVWLHEFPLDSISRFTLSRVAGLQLDLRTPLASAERHLRMATSLDPEHYWAHFWLGIALDLARKPEAAELAYATCVALRPEEAEPYGHRARAILRQLRPTDDADRRRSLARRALAQTDAAVRVAPSDWNGYFYRGDVYAWNGDLARAVTSYTEAVRCGPYAGGPDPEFFLCYSRRGDCQVARGAWGEAVADYTEALRVFPSRSLIPTNARAALHGKRGKARASLGEWAGAETDLRTARDLNPADPDVWVCLASVVRRRGDPAAYRQVCTEAVRSFGGAGDAAVAADIAWACTLGPDAVADFGPVVRLAEKGKAAARDGYRPFGECVLGAALYRAGRFDEAVRALETADRKATGTKSPVATWLYLALVHRRLGHAAEARIWLAKARAWADSVGHRTTDLPWTCRVELEVLLREAEQAVAGG